MASAAAPVAPAPAERSPLVPPDCPIDFPSVDENGGTLLRVFAPPQYPSWGAEYSVLPDKRPCPGCDQPIERGQSRTVVFDQATDGERTVVVGGRWWHSDCAVFAARKRGGAILDRVMFPRRSPCARCSGDLDGGHVLAISNDPEIAGAWCDDDMTQRYVHPRRSA